MDCGVNDHWQTPAAMAVGQENVESDRVGKYSKSQVLHSINSNSI